MKPFFITLFAATLFAAPLHAETVHLASMHNGPRPAESIMDGSMHATSPMSDAVVRKIDAAAGKITLKHGPIPNLDMPPMTMVFRVQPPELLNTVKVGDAVKFHAEEIGGALTVTAIEKAQ